jgi:hypothetical protein
MTVTTTIAKTGVIQSQEQTQMKDTQNLEKKCSFVPKNERELVELFMFKELGPK